MSTLEEDLIRNLRELADSIEKGDAVVYTFTTPNADEACPAPTEGPAPLKTLHVTYYPLPDGGT